MVYTCIISVSVIIIIFLITAVPFKAKFLLTVLGSNCSYCSIFDTFDQHFDKGGKTEGCISPTLGGQMLQQRANMMIP